MKVSPHGAAAVLATSLWLTCAPPAQATDWEIGTRTLNWITAHCLDEHGNPSCHVPYTASWTTYNGHFANQEAADAACTSIVGGRCGYASGEPGPPLMTGGKGPLCPGGLNFYGLCGATQFVAANAHFPTLVVEQDIERPADCRATQRRFGNPIDGLTGEKHEQLRLLDWSTDAPPLRLEYRSARFARQVGISTLAGNNLPGQPGAGGSVGLGMPDVAGQRPFGMLWIHSLDARVTPLQDGVRVSRIQGNAGMSFRTGPDGRLMFPPSDQADRVQFLGGAGGAYWLYRDPRSLQTNYFSPSGMLIHTARADGTGRQWLRYSDSTTPRSVAAGPDRLLAIQDAFGRQLRIGYLRDTANNATDLIGDTTDDSGARTSFEYDTQGRLTAVRWPDGSAQRFGYDATLPWALASRIDELGVSVGNWTWSAATGLVTSAAGADGVNRHVLQFAQPPQVVVTDTLEGRNVRRRYSWQPGTGAQVTLPNGSSVALGAAMRNGDLQLAQRSQPAGAGCDASTSASVLDINGNAIMKDDFAGGRSCHAYDMARNLELVRVEGLDRAANCAALLADGASLPAGARKISTRWHPIWPLAEVVAGPGLVEARVYNDRPDPYAAGAVATCMPWLGGDGLPIDAQPAALCRRVQRATTDANGSQGFTAAADTATPPRDERWTFTRHAQPLSHDGPRTDVADLTLWTYHATTTADARAGDLADVRNGIGHAMRFHRWDGSGRLLSTSDANGMRTDLAYDRRQQLVGITEAAGTPWARLTTQQWDARGLLRRTDPPPVVAGSAVPGGIRYEYDRAHRLIGVFSDGGQGESYQLDASGNVVARRLHHGDDATRPPTVTVRDFDALNRPWREWTTIHGVPRATELQHDAMGRLTAVTRPMVPANGESVAPREQRRYDMLGQLTQVDTLTGGPTATTRVTNDPAGNLAAAVTPGGARFEFDSDGFGQVRRLRGPDTGSTTQAHDAAGNLVGMTDARGVVTTHRYDALNRLIATDRSLPGAGAAAAEAIRYAWDTNPGAPLPCSNGIGRLCRIDDAAGTQHFAYDAFGNLAEQWTVELGQVHRQTFAWDTRGQRIAMSDAGGTSQFGRDRNGQVRVVFADAFGVIGPLVTLDALRIDGDADQRRFGNGVAVRRTRDTSGAMAGQAGFGIKRQIRLCTPLGCTVTIQGGTP